MDNTDLKQENKCECTELQATTRVCDNLSITECELCWYIYKVWDKNITLNNS